MFGELFAAKAAFRIPTSQKRRQRVERNDTTDREVNDFEVELQCGKAVPLLYKVIDGLSVGADPQ